MPEQSRQNRKQTNGVDNGCVREVTESDRRTQTRDETDNGNIRCQELVWMRMSSTCCMEGLVEEAEWDITEVTGIQRVKEDTEVARGEILGMQDEARVPGLG